MTDKRQDLIERVRAALPSERALREVSMFGGLSFLVDDSIVVAARSDGDLLVRIDPARREELLDIPGARPAVMGDDRPMGPRWITVSPDGLTDDARLDFWITIGLEHRGTRARRR